MINTCNDSGTSICSNCLSCDNKGGYYSKEGELSNCLPTKSDNYYFDKNSTPIVYKACSNKWNGYYYIINIENGTNCIFYANEFYKRDSNETTDCLEIKPTDNYYLDKDLNIYMKCSIGSLSWNRSENFNHSLCESFDNANRFYQIEEQSESNFIHKDNKEENYFVDDGHKLIRKCHSKCSSCNKLGTDLETKCLNCSNDFTFAPNSSTHCINPEKENEYYDESLKKFVSCDIAYLSCNRERTNEETNCKNWSTGFYLAPDGSTTNCINNTPYGYYLNSTLNMYMKYFSFCSKYFRFREEGNWIAAYTNQAIILWKMEYLAIVLIILQMKAFLTMEFIF